MNSTASGVERFARRRRRRDDVGSVSFTVSPLTNGVADPQFASKATGDLSQPKQKAPSRRGRGP